MNAIERKYRVMMLRERLQQIEGELIALQDDLMDARELTVLGRVSMKLAGASSDLRCVPTVVDLSGTLAASIEVARAKKRCAEIGAGQ